MLTPKWAREAVAGMDDRKAHDILVRARTAAIFYGILGILLGAGIIAIACWGGAAHG